MTDSNEFYDWMKSVGITRLADAAAVLGIGQRTIGAISGGGRGITTTERLAMSARAQGLGPWGADTPEAQEPLEAPPEAAEPSAPKARRFRHQYTPPSRVGFGGTLKRRKGKTP